MPLLAMILSLKLNISGLLWIAQRAHATDYCNLCLFEQNCRERETTQGRVERWGGVITLYWCPRVWMYLNATQHELQMWALTQYMPGIWNARDTALPSTSFKLIMSTTFLMRTHVLRLFMSLCWLKIWCCKDWRQIEAFGVRVRGF